MGSGSDALQYMFDMGQFDCGHDQVTVCIGLGSYQGLHFQGQSFSPVTHTPQFLQRIRLFNSILFKTIKKIKGRGRLKLLGSLSCRSHYSKLTNAITMYVSTSFKFLKLIITYCIMLEWSWPNCQLRSPQSKLKVLGLDLLPGLTGKGSLLIRLPLPGFSKVCNI